MDPLNNIRYLFGYVGQFPCSYCPGAYWSVYGAYWSVYGIYPPDGTICGYCLPLTRIPREYLRWTP